MTLLCLEGPPEPWLAEALERFERQFEYPLGPAERFRISHGRDYLTFFRAMGKTRLYVAVLDGEVLGTLAHVERRLEINGETASRRLVHYLCDLKVAPAARSTRVLRALMQQARKNIAASESHACYSVVMAGTGRVPTDYTGRIDIPEFAKVAEIVVLRISRASPPAPLESHRNREPAPAARFVGGLPEARSLILPQRLVIDGAAGTLEDTRKGKRLWSGEGAEMMNAHLSNLILPSPGSAARLMGLAVESAHAAGFDAVFTCLPKAAWERMRDASAGLSCDVAPAAVYGYGLPAGWEWWVDSSEI